MILLTEDELKKTPRSQFISSPLTDCLAFLGAVFLCIITWRAPVEFPIGRHRNTIWSHAQSCTYTTSAPGGEGWLTWCQETWVFTDTSIATVSQQALGGQTGAWLISAPPPSLFPFLTLLRTHTRTLLWTVHLPSVGLFITETFQLPHHKLMWRFFWQDHFDTYLVVW